MAECDLTGLRILVVEDEMLVAMLIEDMLADLGCEVVGPLANVQDASRAAGTEKLDAAILDLDLDGTPTFPVADICRARPALPFCDRLRLARRERGLSRRQRLAKAVPGPRIGRRARASASRLTGYRGARPAAAAWVGAPGRNSRRWRALSERVLRRPEWHLEENA